MRKFFIVVLLFLFIFGIPFSFLPFNSSKLVVLALLLWFFTLRLLSKKPSLFNIKNNLFYVSLGLLFLNCLSVIYPVFYDTQDYSLPYAYFIMLFEAFVGGCLLYVLALKRYDFYDFIKVIVFTAFYQSVVILLMLISEPFRELIYLISNVDAKQLMERYGGFRGFGLAGSVTYDLAVYLAINLMFIAYLISVGAIKSRLYIVVYFIIFVAAIMTGRSAWIGIVLSVTIILWNYRRTSLLINVLEGSFYILLFGTALLTLIQYIYPELFNVFIDKIVPYAFELFINLSTTGELSTASSDKISGMYFPVSEGTLMLGDGYYKDPKNPGYYYMGTDAGYMRHILYYGLLPSICLYLFYLVCFYIVYKKSSGYQSSFILVSTLVFYYFVMHYKGDFLTGSAMNIKLFFILLVFMIHNPTSQKEKVYD